MHCIQGVANQIDYDLLNLDAIDHHAIKVGIDVVSHIHTGIFRPEQSEAARLVHELS